MDYLWFALIGLVAGALAGLVLRGHYKALVDVALGIVGALAGGHLFLVYGATLGLKTGLIAGLVFAAIGAGVFLLAVRTTHLGD